jgi:hypothetical protein
VTISNPDLLSTVKQELILEEEAGRSTYLNELNARRPLVVSISQRSEKLRLYHLVWNLKISNPGLKRGIFKYISSLNGSIFMGDFWDVFERGS